MRCAQGANSSEDFVSADDGGNSSEYHAMPENDQTSRGGFGGGSMPPPSNVRQRSWTEGSSPRSPNPQLSADEEWAENLAKRASFEIDRVREDSRRKSKNTSATGSADSNYALL